MPDKAFSGMSTDRGLLRWAVEQYAFFRDIGYEEAHQTIASRDMPHPDEKACRVGFSSTPMWTSEDCEDYYKQQRRRFWVSKPTPPPEDPLEVPEWVKR